MFQSPGYTLAGGAFVKSGTLTIATGVNDVTVASVIKGTAVFSKTGTGTLTLSGANTFAAGTSIAEGLLRAASTTALGTTSGIVVVAADATLDINGNALQKTVRISGPGLGGIGSIVSNGGTTVGSLRAVTLTAPASMGGTQNWETTTAFPSGLTMAGFTLTKVGLGAVDVTKGITTPGNIDIKAGSFVVPGSISGATGKVITVRNGATLGLPGTSSGQNTWTAVFEDGSRWRVSSTATSTAAAARWDGPVTLSGSATVDVAGGMTLDQNSVVSGPGSASKAGDGTWMLNTFNTHSGGTVVNAGTLVLNTANTTTGAAAVSGKVTVKTGGTLRLQKAGALGSSPALRISPLDVTGGLVDNTSNTANSYHIINLTEGTLRSGKGSNPTDQGYFAATNGSIINSLAANGSSVIAGRFDLGNAAATAPAIFHVEAGGAADDLRVDAAVTESSSGHGLTKTGGGVMTLDGPDSHTGGTMIENGAILLGPSGMLASSPVRVGTGAGFGTRVAGKTFASIAAEANSTLVLPAVAGGTTTVAGTLELTGGTIYIAPLLGNGALAGTYDLATAGGITGAGVPVMDLSAAHGPTRATGSVLVNGNKLQLVLSGTGANLLWNNASAGGAATGTWDNTLANFSLGGNNEAFQAFDSVTFDDSVAPGTGKTISLSGTLAPALLTVNNSNGAYAFTSAGGLAGAGSLTKAGTSPLTLGGADSYAMSGDITAGGGVIDFSGKHVSTGKLTLSNGSELKKAAIAATSLDLRSGSISADVTASAGWTKATGGTVEISGNYQLNGPGTVMGGELILHDVPGSLGSAPLDITGGASLTLRRSDTPVFSNAFSGAGTLNLIGSNDGNNSASKFVFSGNSSGFSGSLNITDGSAYVKAPLGTARISMAGSILLIAENVVLSNNLVLAPTGTWGSLIPSLGNLMLVNSSIDAQVDLAGGTTTWIYSKDNWPSGITIPNAINGPIRETGGPASIMIIGSTESILTLSGNSTYTGSTSIQSYSRVNLTGSLGATAVTMSSTTSLAGNGSIGAGGSLTTSGTLRTTLDGSALTVNGNVTLQSTKISPDVSATSQTGGPMPILNYTGTLAGFNTLQMEDAALYRQAVFTNPSGQITLNIGGKALIWKGASSNVWRTGGNKLWNTNGSGETESFYKGDRVTFNDTGTTTTGIAGSGSALEPAAVLFNNSAKDYSLSTSITGPCKVIKQGSGSVRWSGNNSHSGGTAILMGRMEVSYGAMGSGPVTVAAGGTLAGDATITGAVTIAGTVDPGLAGNASPYALSTGSMVLSGTYRCQLDDYSDRLVVTGNLDITGSTLALNRTEPVLGESLDFYTIATYTGTLSGWFSTITGLPAEFEVVHDAANKRILVKPFDFGRWMDGFASLSDTTPNGDPDGDGIPNLMEFMLGGNPASHENSLRPTLGFDLINNLLLVSFKRRDAAIYTTTQALQWATDLMGPWTDRPLYWRTSYGYRNFSENGEAPNDITVDLPRQPGKIFVRLKVERK
ncbi:MAG: autotransporter-associated beta strand repeat-containing protein [Verrucomicrobiota bacterium]